MSCILCGEKKLNIVSRRLRNTKRFKVKKCQTCGLVQLDPVPKSSQIKDIYNTEKISIPPKDRKRIKIKKEFSQRDTSYNSELVSSLINKKARILDYGCGYGFFMEEMLKRGFSVFGTDISEIRLSTSKNICKRGVFFNSEKEIPKNYFNCLTLFHVLEHVSSPVDFLKSVKQHVKRGGKIIIEVPNLDDHLLKISDEYLSLIHI